MNSSDKRALARAILELNLSLLREGVPGLKGELFHRIEALANEGQKVGGMEMDGRPPTLSALLLHVASIEGLHPLQKQIVLCFLSSSSMSEAEAELRALKDLDFWHRRGRIMKGE